MSLHAATAPAPRTRSLTPTSCPDPGPGPGANAGPGSGPGHLVEPGQSQPPLLEYAVVVTSAREHHHPLRPRPARRLACRPARRQVDRGQKHSAGATRVQRLARRHRVCLAADGSLRELLGLELVGRQHRRQRQHLVPVDVHELLGHVQTAREGRAFARSTLARPPTASPYRLAHLLAHLAHLARCPPSPASHAARPGRVAPRPARPTPPRPPHTARAQSPVPPAVVAHHRVAVVEHLRVLGAHRLSGDAAAMRQRCGPTRAAQQQAGAAGSPCRNRAARVSTRWADPHCVEHRPEEGGRTNVPGGRQPHRNASARH